MKVWLITIALMLSAAAAFQPAMPNPKLTPGAITNETAAQLCNKSFHTGSVRNVPESEKCKVFALYGISCYPCGRSGPTVHTSSVARCGAYEVDHLISLEIGGSNDIANLLPEPYEKPGIPIGARHKDKLENYLHRQVCAGKLTLPAAQREIATDWYGVYRRMEK